MSFVSFRKRITFADYFLNIAITVQNNKLQTLLRDGICKMLIMG